jgi:DNA-dependent RNA polymerase auxiliary subunit epsilon
MTTLTPEQFAKIQCQYYRDDQARQHLRLGQYVINYMRTVTDPEIFYEKDDKIAVQKILEKYVK